MPNIKTPVPVIFNHPAIIDAFDGRVDVLRRVVAEEGFNPPKKTAVEQWMRLDRMRISADWLPLILYVALRTGRMTLAEVFISSRTPDPSETSPSEKPQEGSNDDSVSGQTGHIKA